MKPSIEELLIAQIEFEDMCRQTPLTHLAANAIEKKVSKKTEKKQTRYSSVELKKVRKILQDFGIPKKMYAAVPENVITSADLHRWKMALINNFVK